MASSLADKLEIWGFEKEMILFSDASIGFGFRCEPVDPLTWSDETINAYSEKVSQFLNGLPANIDIQFVQDIVPGNESVIKQSEALATTCNNDVAKSIAQARADRLRSLDQLGEIPVHAFHIFVRKPFSKRLLPKTTLFSKEKKFSEISEALLAREIELAERLQEQLSQSLSLIEITPSILSSDDVAALLYTQWNPSRRVSFKSYDPEDVKQSILFSDVGIDLSGFAIGSTYFRVLSLKNLPDQTHSAMAARLRDLPFKSRLLVSVHVPEQMKEIESLQTQRRIAYSMAVGKKSGVSDLESQAKFQDLETLLEQMIAQGQKVFHVSCTVILQSETESDLENQVDQVLMKFRELGGSEVLTETLASFDIFSQSAIPNARTKERQKRIKTSNLCDLLPLYGPWTGHDKPSILLRSRYGSLVKFFPFDFSHLNANQLISGGSGAGKSFMTNLLLLQMLKENPKIYFIDIGGSYKKITENLNGQYVELGLNDQVTVNPFDLMAGETKPSSEKIKFLTGLIELMTKEEDVERLPRLARSEIEAAISQVYRTCEKPRLSDLRALLLKHADVSIQNYGRILASWCGDTPYGKFLDRQTSIELQRDIIAFDLKGLEKYADLQAVCLYIITDLIWREVQRDKSQMKFIVFDECWKLLKDEAGLVFIEEVFRTVRKYFCSAIAISQDLQDFLNSKISSALLPNCSIKWILMQNQSDLSKIKEALGLNENEIDLINSLTQRKGEFSEVYLQSGSKNRIVAVIEPTPLDLWIATMDPRDNSLIKKTQDENPHLTPMQIAELLAGKYPTGAPAA